MTGQWPLLSLAYALKFYQKSARYDYLLSEPAYRKLIFAQNLRTISASVEEQKLNFLIEEQFFCN